MAINCSVFSISRCKQIIAAVECVEVIMQGSNSHIDIYLSDGDGNLLDLNDIGEIFILGYDDRKETSITFNYPDVTSENPIIIMQETLSDGQFENKGLIRVELTESMTSDFMAGGLYFEIKLVGDGTVDLNTYIISCLYVADIKVSMINRYEFEMTT